MIKRILLAGFATVLLFSCVNKPEEKSKKEGNEIYFSQTTYDYGEIPEKSDGLYTIEFKNIGEKAVVINRVRTSCGCTVPSWPKDPIEPGGTGKIEVKYNTELVGSFMKSVYVYSSASNSPVKIMIRGKVVPKEKSS
ncbi:MAG: DUF1573 domain-containing protein [Bacteroidales bacterium]